MENQKNAEWCVLVASPACSKGLRNLAGLKPTDVRGGGFLDGAMYVEGHPVEVSTFRFDVIDCWHEKCEFVRRGCGTIA